MNWFKRLFKLIPDAESQNIKASAILLLTRYIKEYRITNEIDNEVQVLNECREAGYLAYQLGWDWHGKEKYKD